MTSQKSKNIYSFSNSFLPKQKYAGQQKSKITPNSLTHVMGANVSFHRNVESQLTVKVW